MLELRHIDENSRAVPTADEKIPWLPLITAQAFEPEEDSEEGSAEGQASSWDNCRVLYLTHKLGNYFLFALDIGLILNTTILILLKHGITGVASYRKSE